jgi:hypothetical protein
MDGIEELLKGLNSIRIFKEIDLINKRLGNLKYNLETKSYNPFNRDKKLEDEKKIYIQISYLEYCKEILFNEIKIIQKDSY